MTNMERWIAQRNGTIQFDPDVVQTITIYPRWIDPLTANHTNVRCVLRGCKWEGDSISVFRTTGTQTSNSVTAFIPVRASVTGRQYVTWDEWNKADKEDVLNNLWTIPTIAPWPLMINRELGDEFGWGTTGQMATLENNLTSSNRNVRRARDVNEYIVTPEGMDYVLVRC